MNTSKRIAQAYLTQGQLSSAILEYETVLQRRPEDADVRAALKSIEDKASNAVVQPTAESVSMTDTTMMRRRARPTETEGHESHPIWRN